MRIILPALLSLLMVVAPNNVQAQANREVPVSQAQVQLSFAPVVKQVAPAVVNVYATTVQKRSVSPFANDPFFNQFFGPNSPFNQERPRLAQSLGSGVIVDPSGLVLTNSHVVSRATDIKVVTSDGREYAVELILDDPHTDLAALRILDAGDQVFPALTFADSDQLEVGDLVLAIGNPFGVGQTVTSGIVSALARTSLATSDISFYIQTDAAINPGNSGGALVDLQGRLVGINAAIFSNGGGSVGIGFAIPSDMARLVANVGLQGGELVRPWFGARLQDISGDLATSLGLEVPRGTMVAEVAIDGPAAQAGLQSGDVILALDGTSIEDSGAFNYRLATKQVGGTTEVKFIRAGKEQTAQVNLEAAPSTDLSKQIEISGGSIFDGARVATLYPTLAQELGLTVDVKGAVIINVAEASRAEAVGLRPGDVILNLNDVEIVDAETLERVVSQGAQTWRIVIQRDGQVFRSSVSG